MTFIKKKKKKQLNIFQKKWSYENSSTFSFKLISGRSPTFPELKIFKSIWIPLKTPVVIPVVIDILDIKCLSLQVQIHQCLYPLVLLTLPKLVPITKAQFKSLDRLNVK